MAGEESEKRAADDSAVSVSLQPGIVQALDRFVAEHHVGAPRADAIAKALEEWAHMRGYLGTPREGIRPENLNATNDD